MLALDHRSAPTPSYTVHSPVPEAKNLAVQNVSKAFSKTVITPLASYPQNTPGPHSRSSILYPADNFREIVPNVRELSADQLAAAIKEHSTTRLPLAHELFPWLHGINKRNHEQRRFFGHQLTECPTPTTYRGLMIVHAKKVDSDVSGRLVGCLYDSNLFSNTKRDLDDLRTFKDLDVPCGIQLRNFRGQVSKIALLSDIVVYDPDRGSDDTDTALLLASKISEAQALFRQRHHGSLPEYNTFVVSDRFDVFETRYPHLVAVTNDGTVTGNDVDFHFLEREQMRLLSTASEICHNVFLGNTADWEYDSTYYDNGDPAPEHYPIHIQCIESATIPSIRNGDIMDSGDPEDILEISFPSSGSLGQIDANQIGDLIDFCVWIYKQTHKTLLAESDCPVIEKDQAELASSSSTSLDSVHPEYLHNDLASPLTSSFTTNRSGPRKVLITSKDGYTETTMLALAYTVFANCMTLEQAWVHLHREKKRSFYVFDQDVITMKAIYEDLILASPHSASRKEQVLTTSNAAWFSKNFSGNFPSRILPHLYLGNLEQADNFEMLKAIGIDRVLSVGEKPVWLMTSCSPAESPIAYLSICSLQDNGIDPITGYIGQCLAFIEEGVQLGQATLVHCRVGVSRSASICIADVIRRLNLPLESAYLLVRARRLNVIIQPNLLFMYELLRWSQEERSRLQGLPEGQLTQRTMEWATLASKIVSLNKIYIQD